MLIAGVNASKTMDDFSNPITQIDSSSARAQLEDKAVVQRSATLLLYCCDYPSTRGSDIFAKRMSALDQSELQAVLVDTNRRLLSAIVAGVHSFALNVGVKIYILCFIQTGLCHIREHVLP